jgi:ATP-dependent RNA helicase HelY
VPSGRRLGLAVVLDPGSAPTARRTRSCSPRTAGPGGCSLADFPSAVEPVGRLRIPKGFNHRVPANRRDLASALREVDAPGPVRGRRRSAAADDDRLAALRTALRRHPVHGCEDRESHLRWAERWQRLRDETDALERRVAGKTSSIARTFDRVCAVLDRLGYLDGGHVTPAGEQLARVYSESDLLAVESLRARVWDGLGPAELAAVVSSLVYSAPAGRRVQPAGPLRPGAGGAARDGAAVGGARRGRVAGRRGVPAANRTTASPGRPGAGPAGRRSSR